MASWDLVVQGDRNNCISKITSSNVPDNVKAAVQTLIAAYSEDCPVAKRTIRRAKDPRRPIETALSSDGWTHAVGNFEDVTITHKGTYRAVVHGNPDDVGTIEIRIEPDFSGAEVTEAVA